MLTVIGQQSISSPPIVIASDADPLDVLSQCSETFLRGQCSVSLTSAPDVWQYATQTAPLTFKQMNARTNKARNLVLRETTCTTIIMLAMPAA